MNLRLNYTKEKDNRIIHNVRLGKCITAEDTSDFGEFIKQHDILNKLSIRKFSHTNDKLDDTITCKLVHSFRYSYLYYQCLEIINDPYELHVIIQV